MKLSRFTHLDVELAVSRACVKTQVHLRDSKCVIKCPHVLTISRTFADKAEEERVRQRKRNSFSADSLLIKHRHTLYSNQFIHAPKCMFVADELKIFLGVNSRDALKNQHNISNMLLKFKQDTKIERIKGFLFERTNRNCYDTIVNEADNTNNLIPVMVPAVAATLSEEDTFGSCTGCLRAPRRGSKKRLLSCVSCSAQDRSAMTQVNYLQLAHGFRRLTSEKRGCTDPEAAVSCQQLFSRTDPEMFKVIDLTDNGV
ncbi:hypothetical protein EXN66_Car021304 [Channa argus]|uniref:Uncharacterized protein n=1 Tax=Channa argus TaxID=215402 RepID=A0A6G1QTJ2_CHAAH|nr:hypothetical protein EXN66_Car021304 [Channa argus]